MSTTTSLRFSALDTWFFRESRPLEAIGGSELTSIFPPPPRTLMGALRTAIGDSLNANWRDFGSNPQGYRLPDKRRLFDLIGDSMGCGPLSITGPWLVYRNERLYPVPLFLLERNDANGKTHVRLRIGAAAHTSLDKDRVRLPLLPSGNVGAKTLESVWVTGGGLACVLAGGLPAADTLYRAADLFIEEPRLGIARNNTRRVAEDGTLYQTRHLRPKADLAVEAVITLPEGIIFTDRLLRLGGEGRLAHFALHPGCGLPPAPKAFEKACGLILVLLTPARLGEGREGWLPPGFQSCEERGTRVWKGRIGKVPLTLHAAVLGKAQREGGWNLVGHKPRDVVSLIPAGSCYYVTAEGALNKAIEQLHGARIGEEQELGRGQIACALWNENEF